MKRFVCALNALLVTGTVWADYRADLGVSYVHGSADSGYEVPGYTPPTDPGAPPPTSEPSYSSAEDINGWAVDGRYYLDNVDTSRGPWKLAPFLSRASSIGGGYGRTETDGSGQETKFWDADARLIVNERWVLEGRLGGSEDYDGGRDSEVDLYQAAVGFYFAADSQLRVGIDREDSNRAASDRYSIDLVHVQELDNGHTLYANVLVGKITGDDDGSDFDLNLSYYLNQAFGFGLDYFSNSRDLVGDTDGFSVWASYFVTEKISLELNYFKQEFEDTLTIKSDGIEFEAKYRL